MNAVGGHIRKLRRKENMTQQSLADRLNVTRQAVSQWENGNTQPDLDTLAAIAGVFGVDMTEVIYGEKRRETSGIDPQRRKRYLVGLAVFGALTLVMVILSLTLKPYFIEQKDHFLNDEAYLIYSYNTEPLFFLFIPIAVLCLGSLVWDIRISHSGMRWIIFSLMAAYVVFYYTMGLIYMDHLEMPYAQGYLNFFIKNPAIFLLPGIGLFLGLNGHGHNRGQQALSE